MIPDPDVWQTFEDAFKRASNLEGENKAMYQRRFLEGKSGDGYWRRLANITSCYFWGYGVRPLRVLFWMLVLFLVAFRVYWTQTTSMADSLTGRGRLTRFWFTLNFGWQTSLSFSFGPKNSTTLPFKVFTVLHSQPSRCWDSIFFLLSPM